MSAEGRSVEPWTGRRFRSRLGHLAGEDELVEREQRRGTGPLLLVVGMIALWFDGTTLRIGRMRALDVGP